MCKPSIAKIYKKVVGNDNAAKKELTRQNESRKTLYNKCNRNVTHV